VPEKQRHIIHLTSADIWRGAEQQIIYLYQGLSRESVKQIIFCSQNSQLLKYCRENNISTISYKRNSGANWNLVQALRKYCKTYQPDIIHIHDPHAHNAYVIAYLMGLRTPAILHRRVDFPTATNYFSAFKYNIHTIRKIVCVSEKVKAVLYNRINNPERLTVHYDCTDISAFERINGRQLLEKDYPQLKDKYIIADIAALVDHKDHPTFIRTAHYLVHVLNIKEIHFLIMGEGILKKTIHQLLYQYQLEKYVTMTGFRKDLPALLNGIDTYVFTSKMEGFGSTILQVMSAKVPIVATKTGGPAEILEHKKTALLASTGDHISLAHHLLSLKEKHTLKKQLVENAYQLVRQFSIEQHVQEISAIHQQILKQPK